MNYINIDGKISGSQGVPRSPLQPRDYQLDAVLHALRINRTLLISPTASGKSLILYMMVRWLHENESKKKGLIIVPTINLTEQLYSDFDNYSKGTDWTPKDNCHIIYSGKEKDTDLPITISTWQSIYKLPNSYFHQFDYVLGDECHLFQSKSLTGIMSNLINAKVRVGVTGTLSGSKTHEMVLTGLFGDVKNVTTTKELVDAKHLSELTIKCILLKHNDSICKLAKNFSYHDEMKYLIGNDARNKFITNLAASLTGNTLVLYQFVEYHGQKLYDILKNKYPNRKIFFIHGQTDVDDREAIRKLVETEKNAIIIASYGTFSTGINIVNLNNIIFASPSKSRIRNLQSIGRGLRRSKEKMTATLYDISDDLKYKKKNNYTLNHFLERIKLYGEEHFAFKVYKVELK
jgi:superfamily II DNA or RNA helicase